MAGKRTKVSRMPPKQRAKVMILIREQHRNRTPRAKTMDARQTASRVYDEESDILHPWQRHPGRYERVDTQKTAGPAYESDGFHAARRKQYSVPLKYAAQIAFPHAAVPIEVGYIFLCSLDAIRAEYGASESDRSPELGDALNIAIREIEKQTMSYVIPPIGNDAVAIIAEKSSEYLEQAQLFTTLTERLGSEESYSRDFRYFYETSLKSCLNQKSDEHADWLR